jgi:DNA polymerase-3 subunit epsilon
MMELEQKKCITGQSESGLCGTAAFCAQPYKCCAECNEHCNVRCGWANGKEPGAQETQGNGLERLLDTYRNIVFFDTETTGFNAQSHKIIELAAIGVRRGAKGEPEIWREMDVYCRLPDGQKIPEKIVELTGITDQMLAEQGITEDEMAEQFAEIITGEYGKDLFENLKDTLLVAHNAQFDLNFTGYLYILQMAHDKEGPQFRRWLHEFNDADYLDTLTIYKDRAAYPHKLANAIEHYGLQDSVVNSHRAVDDVKALMEVAKAMGRERNDLLNYINIFGYNQKYGVSGRQLKKVTYAAQPFRNEIAPPDQTLPELLKRGRQ